MAASEQVEIDDARRIVLDSLAPLPAVEIGLDAALGRVLAEDVRAGGPLPPFDSSAMDGYAVRSADLQGAAGSASLQSTAGSPGSHNAAGSPGSHDGATEEGSPVSLRVVDESRAGHPAHASLGAGEAIAISTGALIPMGADAIVRVERTRREDGVVHVLESVPAGAEIRRAGEDVRAGEAVLARGTALGPPELGMLASLGRACVLCARTPRVSVLVTGDELLAPGQAARPGAIYDSSSHAIAAFARCAGAHVLRSETVRDDEPSTRSALAEAAADSDAIVVCGGVSVGEHDHVRPSLLSLGASQAFWGLALKPGHPTWFGTLNGKPVFGLPGNPVSAMVTFMLLAAPALRALQGEPQPLERPFAVLDGGYEKPAGRAHALRCRLSAQEDGWHAEPTGPQGSHVASSMLAADALAIVPSGVTRLEPGARVEIEPLRRWVASIA